MILRKAVQACLVRIAFFFHGIAGALTLTYFTQLPAYLVICLGLFFFMLELVTTLRYNEKGEWRWFIPAVVIYIAFVVPVVWATELGLIAMRISLSGNNTGNCLNTFNIDCKDILDETVGGVPQKKQARYCFGQSFSTLYQQSFMLVLILGRWFMPKGGMTRDELSQLLLVYVAMAADMLEFSIETLRLEEVACEKHIFIAILSVWSWSLLQFSFGQSVANKRSRRHIRSVLDRQANEPPVNLATYLCGSETWALMTDVFLQDGPYLVIRTYVIIQYRIKDTILIFFAVKNLLLVVMQVYRCAVLIIETGDEAKRRRDAAEALGLSVLIALQNAPAQQNGQPANTGQANAPDAEQPADVVQRDSTGENLTNGGFQQDEENMV